MLDPGYWIFVTVHHMDAGCSKLVKDPVSSIEYRASRIEHRGCVFVPVAERLPWILDEVIMNLEKRNIEVLDELMIEVLREKTPQQRLIIAFNLWESAKKQLTNYLSSLHPNWDEEKIHYEVVRRLSHGTI
ncbi:MAG: hypothetical protein AB1797_04370 [bacterium]